MKKMILRQLCQSSDIFKRRFAQGFQRDQYKDCGKKFYTDTAVKRSRKREVHGACFAGNVLLDEAHYTAFGVSMGFRFTVDLHPWN